MPVPLSSLELPYLLGSIAWEQRCLLAHLRAFVLAAPLDA